MAQEPNQSRPQGPPRRVLARSHQALFAPTQAEQRTARIMGAWFLGTFLFSIPAFFLYEPILNDIGYVVGSGKDTQVGIGAVLEILLAISGIATAVVIFPVVKRVSESIALGYIASRTVESVLILIGVLSLISVVALRRTSTRPRVRMKLSPASVAPWSPSTNRPACWVRSYAPDWAMASFSAT